MGASGLSGPGFLQVAAALAAVLGLVVVVLRGLQRLQGGSDTAEVRLLSVRRLGPRREIQRLRVGERVHTIYRHDGAMVVLAEEPWTPEALPAAGPATPAPLPTRLRALAAAAGSLVRRPAGG